MTLRHIRMEGCFNFRDLGGYPAADGRVVRYHRLYRADSVHRATTADVEVASETLKLRTLVDLRSEVELRIGGTGLLAEAGLPHHHFPFTGPARNAGIDAGAPSVAPDADRSPPTMAARYRDILEHAAPIVLDAVRVLANPEAHPAVFYCSAGKDRTGVLASVVLSTLGVPDEHVALDYERTGTFIEPIIRRLGSGPGAPAMYRDNPPEHFMPYAETMHLMLASVRDDYGSMRGYLEAKGLSLDVVKALETAMLH